MNAKLFLALAIAPLLAAVAMADGNVVVAVDPETRELRITGDALPNDVEVTSDGGGGAYTVTGRNGTTVNLLASVAVTDVRAFLVDTGDGADTVALTSTPIRSSLRVRLGEGADTLVMNGVRIRGRTAIRCGGGNDHVVARGGSVFLGTVTVSGNGDDDNIELLDAVFNARVQVNAGSGENIVLARGATFERHALLQVVCGDGTDLFEVDHCSLDNDLKVDLNGGDDQAILSDTNFGEDVSVNGGGGGNDDLSSRTGNNFSGIPSYRSFEE
jgi:hypothetical protein